MHDHGQGLKIKSTGLRSEKTEKDEKI